MKKIATLISLMLLGLLLLNFSRNELINDSADKINDDEPYEDLIGQETLKHL